MSKTGEVVSLSRGARGDRNPFSYSEGLQRLKDGAALPTLAMGADYPGSWKHLKTQGLAQASQALHRGLGVHLLSVFGRS